ncbi:TPA: recombinase family protein [Enterobacter hormaechei subsp. xiangfangensis]|nr:recombinase family protein [Enterobacter hormaechei subsp. xiangfangensis]HAV1860671.1 recombinase family protein [Enterobacter hormaechei subsp. xiangfangensis]
MTPQIPGHKAQPQMQAISYTRFSSEIQKKGVSVQRQNGLVNDWLDRNQNYNLVASYYDEAKSAFKGEHNTDGGDLHRLIDDITNKRLFQRGSVLLVEAVDRLSRQGIVKTNQIIYAILEAGVNIVLLSDGDTVYTWEELNTNPLLSMVITMKAEQAREESAKKSKRGLNNWQNKRAAAKDGKIITRACPAWLEVNEDRTAFNKVPGHWLTVQRIFKMRNEEFLSMANISKRLNSEGVENFKGGFGKWNQSTIQQLLINPAVYGLKVISKQATEEVKATAEDIDGYYTVNGETPITKADFLQAQRQVKEWAKGRVSHNDSAIHVNLFKTVLVCGHCGSTIIQSSVTTNKMGYYVCSMRRQGRCHEAQAIRRDIVEQAIVQGLMYNVETMLKGSNIEKEELRQLEAERELTFNKREKLVDFWMSGRLSDEKYQANHDQLTATLDQIDYQLQSLRVSASAEATASRIKNLDVTKLEDRMKIQLLSKDIFKSIRLDGNKKTADIEMKAGGFRLLDYPLDRLIDGDKWIEVMMLTDTKEHTFTNEQGRELLHTAPEWVREEEKKEDGRLPVEVD